MRSTKQFFSDIIRKPPILFPLVGGFHIFILLLTIWSDRSEPLSSIVWLEVLWMLGYTTFWLAVCDLRKWGANGYILLTIINSLLYILIRTGKVPIDYHSNMFLIDGVLSIILLVFYKRFR